jgi:hypothetical protein
MLKYGRITEDCVFSTFIIRIIGKIPITQYLFGQGESPLTNIVIHPNQIQAYHLQILPLHGSIS